jgi:hypothetical protein
VRSDKGNKRLRDGTRDFGTNPGGHTLIGRATSGRGPAATAGGVQPRPG